MSVEVRSWILFSSRLFRSNKVLLCKTKERKHVSAFQVSTLEGDLLIFFVVDAICGKISIRFGIKGSAEQIQDDEVSL